MLHLRVVCPSEKTAEVVELLRGQTGVVHVILHPDVVVPSGDLIEAEVAREAADEVVEALRALELDQIGGITLEVLDTSLSEASERAEEQAPGEGADAVVWQELVSRTGEESRLTITFQVFLTIACLLAAVGVVTNSPVTIVGAMVVGPEFGPLAAVAVALVLKKWDLLRRGLLALAVGFPLAMLLTFGVALLGEQVGFFDAAALRDNHQVDFVYQVGPYSLIVALLAGAAGMLSMTSAKSAALVGVFISVTTVPAAGYAVIAVILGQWDRFGGSVAQLAVNLSGIVLAAALVLLLRRRNQASPTKASAVSR